MLDESTVQENTMEYQACRLPSQEIPKPRNSVSTYMNSKYYLLALAKACLLLTLFSLGGSHSISLDIHITSFHVRMETENLMTIQF